MRHGRLSPVLLAPLLLSGVVLAGCGIADASKDPRGHRVDPELLTELVPGVQTRSDVTALLGSPSSTAPFGPETWYYIGGVTQNRVGRIEALIEQEVVAVHFDRNGVLERFEVVTKDEAKPIEPVARVTPTPGNEVSFVGMLLGNIGRFSPGGQPNNQGPGAPSP